MSATPMPVYFCPQKGVDILIIQTAFIGDVVLATPLIEKLRRAYPHAQIDFLLRKGNEGLLHGHPHLREVLIWDKKKDKYRGLWRLLGQIRARRYHTVVNCQRFAASGLLTACSGARHTCGFDKNPLSFLFSKRIPHRIGTASAPVHEVDRNLSLIYHLTDTSFQPPRLYPLPPDYVAAEQHMSGKYVCIAPTSVWHTKQYPAHKWAALIQALPLDCTVCLLGGPADFTACQHIADTSGGHRVLNLAGRLSFLESAALMQKAAMNYVNDSAPLHIASAMDAPVTAVFCSTLPAFGFTPLSTQSRVVQTHLALPCRPCGLHGRAACPEGHFQCAESIQTSQFPVE